MDTAEVDTEQIEQQMRETRARIDRKLDALSARTAFARQKAPWVVGALLGFSVAVAFWGRRRRAKRYRRGDGVPSGRREFVLR